VKRVSIGAVAEFSAPSRVVNAEGQSVIVIRTSKGLCAVLNRCSHLPLPLAGGKIEGDTITCPFHMSKFDVCSGQNLDWTAGVLGVKAPAWSRGLIALGKSPQPVQTYRVTEENGQVFLELA
jgi:nitrite reductase/ring-hydroxylating ferredoxin subunit